ncbi:MAG: T9SS type A sorting domain-containing protein [Bacteroidetes bacterium]|nr:T9SS type A sorting domain-containing protein [Bacteroidota bacterium]
MFRRRRSLLPFFILVISCVGYLQAQPHAAFSVDIDSGAAPLSLQFFDLSTIQDSIIGWSWDLDGDGIADTGEKNPRWTYEVPGRYTITLIVRDSTSSDTARYVDFIDVAPVEEDNIACLIRLVEYSAPLAKYIELWGYAGTGLSGPLSPVSLRMPLDTNSCAAFYWSKFLPVFSQNITDVLVLDENYRVIGKAGFSYPYKDLVARRRRDAVVFLHRDLISYQQHPREMADLSGWIFPSRVRFPWLPGVALAALAAAGDSQDGPLCQTTVLLPPAAHDSGASGFAQFRLANIRPDRIPYVLLPEKDRMRNAWGEDNDIITPADTLQPDFNGKRDYVFTSYTGRLQREDHNHANRFDVWEYYYPPDQNWEESGYLFARDLSWLLDQYDTSQAAVAAHGMGGLVLRSYLEGTARNFTYFGDPASAVPYRGDLFKAVMLGTPHAGRLRAGMAYAGPDALPMTDVTDRHAPALRELMPGRDALLRLDPMQLPAGISVLNIAGSAAFSPPATLVESALHDDGETALSSAAYPAPRTINGVLGGYASQMLQSPDDGDAGQFDAPDAQLVPELLYAFALSDTTLGAYRSRFLIYNPPDTLLFSQQEYPVSGAPPLRVDVGLPTLRIMANGVPFPASDRVRLHLDLSSGNRLRMEPVETYSDLDDNGLYFYPSSLCFSDDPVIRQLTWQEASFFAVSHAGGLNPFRGTPLLHSGLGWQLAVQQQSIIPDPILSRADDMGRSFDVARGVGDLRMSWSREKRNALVITPHEAMLLDPQQILRGARPDSGAFVDFTVDCLTDQLSVLLDYGSNSAPLFALMAPGGAPVGAAEANDSTVFFTHNVALRVMFITVKHPAPGEWRLLVDNAPALPSGCRLAYVAGASKELQLTVTPSEPLSRQQIVVTLALDNTGAVATETSASCVIIDSTGNRAVIPVHDDGTAPDVAANDGVFTGTVQLGRAGSYRIEGFYFATAGGCRIRRSAARNLVLLPSLELLAPVGAEEWKSGTQKRIRWQGVAAQQIALDFSADGGGSWTEFAGPLPAADGSYLWTVPGITSTACRIRVRDVSGSISDASPANFTIYLRPEVTLTVPNGGEEWQVATTHDVHWTSIAVDRINLAYSTNNGRTWRPIESAVNARLGGYSWRVPITASDSCLLRIVSSDDVSVFDRSDAGFRITAIPALSLLSPNGGERWRIGSTHAVRWQQAEIDSVRIDLSLDAGATWEQIAAESAHAGEWWWDVPDRVSDRCLMRVTATDHPQLTDESNAVFAITPEPFLQLLAPVGGESWEIGTSRNIRWASAEIASVDIDYSLDNGQNWITAAVNIPAVTGSYAWAVPSEPTDFCRVRLTDTYDTTRIVISPLPFRISESETRPTLFAPKDRADGESTRPILRWLPFNGALTYQLQVTNDVTLNTWVINENGLTTTTYQAPELAKNTKYFWRVKAYRSGWVSEWSTMWEFTTSGSTLTAPSLMMPLNGAIGLPTTTNLRWNPVPDADAYHLQIAFDDQFTSLVDEQTGLTGLTALASNLAFDTDYWWRLRAGNTSSTAQSDWSRAWKFSTAPAAPRQLTPFDGFPDVPLNTLLNWYPVLGARSYRLQLATDRDFNTIVFDSSGIVSTTLQTARLWSFWTYYWRLNVTTAHGTSDWNTPWMFRTVDLGTAVEAASTVPVQPSITGIWPQPADDVLTVSLSFAKQSDYQLVIFDMLGRTMIRTIPVAAEHGSAVHSLRLDGLKAGFYLLQLQTPDSRTGRMIRIR